ncbi:Tfp pilus assembly protein PilF, partial [candidate division KSB3 bacterium]
MPVITIRQTAALDQSPNAEVSIDRRIAGSVTIHDPFDEAQEDELNWYFEDYLKFPFLKELQAKKAADSLIDYGESLFRAVFQQDFKLFGFYSQARQQGFENLSLEIVGAPDFQRLHWESLKDPDLPRALSLDAPIVRSSPGVGPIIAESQDSPTLNVLLIVARPFGQHDVGYRTISRPLLEMLRQAKLPIQVDMVRPGSYPALDQHLRESREQHGTGYYHVIHFDMHGALLSYEDYSTRLQSDRYSFQQRRGQPDIAAYKGLKAFLAFEGEQARPAMIEAGELAGLLSMYKIPIAVLNACQSGKQAGARESSLAGHLLKAGMRSVLAMSYSVTVSAAALMMQQLYERLFDGADLPAAVCRARAALFNDKERRAYFEQRIDLEDWLLPVLYQYDAVPQNRAVRLQPMDGKTETAYYEKQARRYRAPTPEFGFVGRDLDILEVEKRLLARSDGLSRNMLLIRGMGGAGKTTLLRHLAEWWQSTQFVDLVFFFAYDQKAYSLQQIVSEIAQQLFGQSVGAMPLAAQQQKVAQALRSQRHLLILDNLESVSGDPLAVKHSLPPDERGRIQGFLQELLGGRSLLVLGSRAAATWLMPAPLRDCDIYDLPGLDPEAASVLAERILQRRVADPAQRSAFRTDTSFARLLNLLDRFPLALEVVLSNLKSQTPQQILAALQGGDRRLDSQDQSDKTRSILACIDYAHSNLSPEAQSLLLCFAPFSSVIWIKLFGEYVRHLQEEPDLRALPLEDWEAIVQDARDWGLLSAHERPGYLKIQPTLPYFLRARLAEERLAGLRAAINSAFCRHYDDFGDALDTALSSRNPQESSIARDLVELEYENLHRALQIALTEQRSIGNLYAVLDQYLGNFQQDHARALDLAQGLKTGLERYGPERIAAEPACWDWGAVLYAIGCHQLELKQLPQAQAAFQEVLQFLAGLQNVDARKLSYNKAATYHQLGMVAQAQREWAQAEQAYEQALAIQIEFKDRYSQASTYHNLGVVAQAQRQWAQAEQAYQQALAIDGEFKDRYSQAATYHQLGSVAEEQRQWAQAEQAYQQALAIQIEFKDRYSQARTYHQLGMVAQAQRQWAQAEQAYEQALAIQIEFKDRYEQAGTYHQLGRVAEEQGQWAQAEQAYQQALAIKIEFKDRYSQARTYHQLGVVAQAQRQWAQAEQAYQQALAIYGEFKDRYEQAATYHQL